MQPAASAGASERIAIPSGKFQGTICAVTPIGSSQREVDEGGAERDRRALDLVGRAGIVAQGRDDAVDVAARIPSAACRRRASRGAQAPPCAAATRIGELAGAAARARPASISRQGAAQRRGRAAGTAASTSAAVAARDFGDRLLGRGIDGRRRSARRRLGRAFAGDDAWLSTGARCGIAHPLMPPERDALR